MLILSQVVLSLQLSFAVVPLVRFTGSERKMGPFVNPRWLKSLAWLVAGVIMALNGCLVYMEVRDWILCRRRLGLGGRRGLRSHGGRG